MRSILATDPRMLRGDPGQPARPRRVLATLAVRPRSRGGRCGRHEGLSGPMKIESISPVQPSQDAGAETGAFRGAFGDPRGRSRRRPFQRGGLARWLARNVAGDPRAAGLAAPRRRRRHAAGGAHGPAQVSWMPLPLALLLGGCVSQPAPMSPKVTVGGSVGGVSAGAPGATQAAPVCRRSGGCKRLPSGATGCPGCRCAMRSIWRSTGWRARHCTYAPSFPGWASRRSRRAPGSGWRRASMSGSGWFGATVFRIVRPLARKKDLATIDTLPAVSESAYGD